MDQITLYWNDGTKQLVVGNDVEHAFERHQIPLFRIPQLSFTSTTGDTHYWDIASSTWQEYSQNVTITKQTDQQATRTLSLDQFYRTKQLIYQEGPVTLTLTRKHAKYTIIGTVASLELQYKNTETKSHRSETLMYDQDYYGVLGFIDLMYDDPINEAVQSAFTPISDLRQASLNAR